MKIRSSFVTNSSSSSFIISSKKDLHKCDSTASFKFDLTAVIDEVIVNKDDLDQYFEDYYGDDWREDEPDFVDKYNDMLSQIATGTKFYIGDVTNEGDSGIEYILYYSGLNNVTMPNGVYVYEDSL